MSAIFKTLMVLVLSAVTQSVLAAPSPGAGTSAVTNPKLGLYHSSHGFQISSAETDWQVSPPPAETKYIVTMYESPKKFKDVKASLTVRVDNLKKAVPLKDYVQQWMRDYPKFGFEVLGSKPFAIGSNQGYVVDLKTKSADKQLRQVVFVKDKKAVILTCRDHIDNFTNTIKTCNSIIKTFSWVRDSKDEDKKDAEDSDATDV